jgi:S-adenosyl-L-methionine hydrolase (adenosine-forming)
MVGLVTFLSDFGNDDVFVGLCHAAVLGNAPDARIIDLTHAVPPQDVVTGAGRLADCVGHVGGAATWADVVVHLAVVDPGVGTDRAPVALRTASSAPPTYLVGPDNGLLQPAAARLGGVADAWRLSVGPAASATFHGRDVFAPAAGALAAGRPPADLGVPQPVAGLVALSKPAPRVTPGALRTVVRDIDVYGNVQLAATAADLVAAGLDGAELHLVAMAAQHPLRAVSTFAELRQGGLGLVTDSFGWLAVVARGGDAAAVTGTVRGADLELAAVVTEPDDVGQ